MSLKQQNTVVLASTIFDAKATNEWVDKNGSITVPNATMEKIKGEPRKRATSYNIPSYQETYY